MIVQVEATFGKAALAWWAITWRALCLAVIAGFGVGIVLGIVGAVAGIDKADIQKLSLPAGLLVGIFASIGVTHRLMTKGFGRYRLALLEK